MYSSVNFTAAFPVASNIFLGIELNGRGTSTLMLMNVSALMVERSVALYCDVGMISCCPRLVGEECVSLHVNLVVTLKSNRSLSFTFSMNGDPRNIHFSEEIIT